jgi:hypothetical protein
MHTCRTMLARCFWCRRDAPIAVHHLAAHQHICISWVLGQTQFTRLGHAHCKMKACGAHAAQESPFCPQCVHVLQFLLRLIHCVQCQIMYHALKLPHRHTYNPHVALSVRCRHSRNTCLCGAPAEQCVHVMHGLHCDTRVQPLDVVANNRKVQSVGATAKTQMNL